MSPPRRCAARSVPVAVALTVVVPTAVIVPAAVIATTVIVAFAFTFTFAFALAFTVVRPPFAVVWPPFIVAVAVGPPPIRLAFLVDTVAVTIAVVAVIAQIGRRPSACRTAAPLTPRRWGSAGRERLSTHAPCPT